MSNPFMERAIQLSIDHVTSERGGPFGAVIGKESRIVAEGVSRVTGTNDPTAHAEITAIREACAALRVFELVDCEISSSCEPCPMCLGAHFLGPSGARIFPKSGVRCFQNRIRRFFYREIAQSLRQRTIPMIPMMREQALAAFHTW